MIWESWPWKKELHDLALYLSAKKKQRRWPVSATTKLEKEIFLGFYIIRKLIESNKLTDACDNLEIKVKTFPSKGKFVTHTNWHKSDEHFDLTKPNDETISLHKLTNQFIHSFIFHQVLDQKYGLTGFLVASDYQKSKSLIQVDVNEVIRACKRVSKDDIASLHIRRDPKTHKETFVKK